MYCFIPRRGTARTQVAMKFGATVPTLFFGLCVIHVYHALGLCEGR